MKLRTALPLVSVLLALCVAAVPAWGAPPRGGLDQSFGQSGIATATVPEQEDDLVRDFVVAPDGDVYVLDGSVLLAFQSDGQAAGDFGENGQVTVAPAVGEGEPAGLAIDSEGRILVVGSIEGEIQRYNPAYTAYVIRLLPDGSRDPGFGTGGEVDTDFGFPAASATEGPSVRANSIVIDPGDRPVIGGSFGKDTEPCGVTFTGGPDPFVARLTATGAIDATFGKAGRTELKGSGGVTSVARTPGGNLAVFTRPCSTPPRLETRSPLFSVLTGNGAKGRVKNVPLAFSYGAPVIDSSGRIVELESFPPVVEGPDHLTRYLPNGHADPKGPSQATVSIARFVPGP